MGKFIALLITIALPLAVHAAIPAPSVRTVYTGSNVTTSTAVTLVTSMSQACYNVVVFDSGGQTMQLTITNPDGSIDKMIIPPGGGGFPAQITTGAKVQLIAISGTPAAGENDINFFY